MRRKREWKREKDGAGENVKGKIKEGKNVQQTLQKLDEESVTNYTILRVRRKDISNNMPYHIISYHIISYHIISYHIIAYHSISYLMLAVACNTRDRSIQGTGSQKHRQNDQTAFLRTSVYHPAPGPGPRIERS